MTGFSVLELVKIAGTGRLKVTRTTKEPPEVDTAVFYHTH